jgi:chemotaxis protein methyltransferase CheR
MTLTRDDFEFLRGLLHRQSAITLDDGKEYLAQTRLLTLARKEGLDSVSELITRLRVDRGHALTGKVVEAMTTNETSFFRDFHPFETLRSVVLPDLIRRRSRQRRLRTWSAACSSGQEPYSLAMIIREHFPELQNWDLEILASDLSTEMVERARAGRYSQLEVNRGIPAPFLLRHFRRDGLHWQIDDSIRRMVDFRPINLIQPWPSMAPLDLIFLRNVLIYFDADSKKKTLSEIARVLQPDGYVFLGGSETPMFTNDLFERIGGEGGGYRLKGNASASQAGPADESPRKAHRTNSLATN